MDIVSVHNAMIDPLVISSNILWRIERKLSPVNSGKDQFHLSGSLLPYLLYKKYLIIKLCPIVFQKVRYKN